MQLNFPPNVEVKVLLEYVSKRLNMNLLYDESVGQKRVTISCPERISKSSLPGLLQSVLKMSQLTMADTDQPGWKKIVPVNNLAMVTSGVHHGPEAPAGAEAGAPVTQVFLIQHASVQAVDQLVRPFLSQPGGNTFPVPEQNLLIVTDYAGNIQRVVTLVGMIDRPGRPAVIRLIPLTHGDATEVARQGMALLQEKARVAASPSATPIVTLLAEPRTNHVAIIAREGAEGAALEVIRMLDVPMAVETRSYRLRHASPRRVDQLARELAEPERTAGRYRSVAVPEAGLLMVTARPLVHQQIESLLEALDVPETDPELSHIRFYKLMNTTAADVINTIRQMDSGPKGLASLARRDVSTGATELIPDGFVGPNRPPPQLEPPLPPAYAPVPPAVEPASPGAWATASPLAAETHDAMVTADTNTNTVIVIAPPPVQEVYRQLIAVLDKRRPQVMIEVTLVTVDTTGGYSIGVELSRLITHGDNSALIFSAFGLSTVNPVTGQLAITPGLGFNAALMAPDVANAVIRAVATDSRARVLSAPKVLVNDNADAELTSVAEAPFTSVNASQTVSTTSFAGYASAGTTIRATPHISEGDHLQLKYTLTLNSFTGSGGVGIPPPRQTNAVTSEITIPDGYTVVVGGLTTRSLSRVVTKVPLLGDIPLLGYLFSQHDRTDAESTLFVFIRPVILRDDQFEDLKYYSERDLDRAQLPGHFPTSEPLLLH